MVPLGGDRALPDVALLDAEWGGRARDFAVVFRRSAVEG
jgi:hypothetical protein